MKRKLLQLIIFSTIFTTGCFSYMDMNRVYFSTFSIIDKEENGDSAIYGEYFASDRGDTEQGGLVTRIVLKGSGRSSNETFLNIQGTATYPIKYDLTRAIGFTERMARDGIEEDLDFLERDQNITNKLFLFVCSADPEELLNVQMADEKFLGIWLEDIFIFQESEARVLSIRANNYLNERLKGSRISVLPILDIIKMPTENRLYISGAAIMRDNKMVDRLTPEEIPVYKILFLKDKDMIGTFKVKEPSSEADVVLSLLLTKIEEKIESIDDELTLIYDLKLDCNIHSVVGKLDLLKKDTREKVLKVAEEYVNKRSEEFYKKFQKRGIDILNVQLKLFRIYGNMEIADDTFRSVNIKVNTTIKLDGSQNITNTLN